MKFSHNAYSFQACKYVLALFAHGLTFSWESNWKFWILWNKAWTKIKKIEMGSLLSMQKWALIICFVTIVWKNRSLSKYYKTYAFCNLKGFRNRIVIIPIFKIYPCYLWDLGCDFYIINCNVTVSKCSPKVSLPVWKTYTRGLWSNPDLLVENYSPYVYNRSLFEASWVEVIKLMC